MLQRNEESFAFPTDEQKLAAPEAIAQPCGFTVFTPNNPSKVPFPKASQQHPPMRSPHAGTFSRRPLAQPPRTLHILILINVIQVTSFSLPAFPVSVSIFISICHLPPWFPASISRENAVFHGCRITLGHLDLVGKIDLRAIKQGLLIGQTEAKKGFANTVGNSVVWVYICHPNWTPFNDSKVQLWVKECGWIPHTENEQRLWSIFKVDLMLSPFHYFLCLSFTESKRPWLGRWDFISFEIHT